MTLLGTSADGDTLIVAVQEHTRLYYESPEADDLETEEFCLGRTLTFQRVAGAWTLVDALPDAPADAVVPSTRSPVRELELSEEPQVLLEGVGGEAPWAEELAAAGEDGTSRIGPRDETPGEEWIEADAEEAGPAGCQV